jgi:hypothetical protein
MEPKDLPADLLLVVRARKYLDYQQRMIEHIYDDVPPPTDRSIRSYKAFEAWIDWAKDYKEKQGKEDTKHSFGTEADLLQAVAQGLYWPKRESKQFFPFFFGKMVA